MNDLGLGFKLTENGIAVVENLTEEANPKKSFRFFDFKTLSFFQPTSEKENITFNFSKLYNCQLQPENEDTNIECVWFDEGNELVLINIEYERHNKKVL